MIRPIWLPVFSVNQRLPSGPAVMPFGPLLAVMPVENSVTMPAGVIRPIRLPVYSVNQRLPSGPADDAVRAAARRDPGELGDGACRGDPADLVAVVLGEPEIAVRPRRDAVGAARRRDGELGDRAAGGDAADLVVGILLGEPEVAVRSRRDAGRAAACGGDGILVDDRGGGGGTDRVDESRRAGAALRIEVRDDH